ncbi:hypothetical protein IWX64_002992 [Arthrobacter sp. CAN_A212]
MNPPFNRGLRNELEAQGFVVKVSNRGWTILPPGNAATDLAIVVTDLDPDAPISNDIMIRLRESGFVKLRR